MKIGVLGLGSIGARHHRNLTMLGHEVIVYDPNIRLIIGFEPIVSMARDDLIASADAMVIATPTACHYRDLLDCMAAGKPTFVEKPMAATRQEWRDLHNYLSTAQVFVGYNLRFHACVIRARRWLDHGLIGKPLWGLFACAQFTDKLAYRRDSVILNWSHEIDLARYLLGPALVLRAATHQTKGADDIADLVLLHQGGARSAIHLDYVSKPTSRFFKIFGTDGAIDVDLHNRQAAIYDADRKIASTIENGRRLFGGDSWDENYVDEMQAFLDHIAGKPTNGATGVDGLDVLGLGLDAEEMA